MCVCVYIYVCMYYVCLYVSSSSSGLPPKPVEDSSGDKCLLGRE